MSWMHTDKKRQKDFTRRIVIQNRSQRTEKEQKVQTNKHNQANRVQMAKGQSPKHRKVVRIQK